MFYAIAQAIFKINIMEVLFGYEGNENTWLWFSTKDVKITIPSGLTIRKANQMIYNFLVQQGIKSNQLFDLCFVDRHGIKHSAFQRKPSDWITCDRSNNT